MRQAIGTRKIPAAIDPATLARDLGELEEIGKEKGAAEIAAIDSAAVIFDPALAARVEADSRYRSAHWPVRYHQDSIEEAVRTFQKGIFFRLSPPIQVKEYREGPVPAGTEREAYLKVYEIVSMIEARAFYLGYHLAVGFAAGNCRGIFCAGEKRCAALGKAEKCIHPLRSRPSLEAVGIDGRGMARERGWDLPEENAAFLAGLVMIA